MSEILSASDMKCSYPDCNCPFDHPGTLNWCARGLAPKATPTTPAQVMTDLANAFVNAAATSALTYASLPARLSVAERFVGLLLAEIGRTQRAQVTPEPLTASMCASPDYAKGWNDCLIAMRQPESGGVG